MNTRIKRKVLKRACSKLEANYVKGCKKTYVEVIEENPPYLSGVEKKVYLANSRSLCAIMDNIIDELKAEGKW